MRNKHEFITTTRKHKVHTKFINHDMLIPVSIVVNQYTTDTHHKLFRTDEFNRLIGKGVDVIWFQYNKRTGFGESVIRFCDGTVGISSFDHPVDERLVVDDIITGKRYDTLAEVISKKPLKTESFIELIENIATDLDRCTYNGLPYGDRRMHHLTMTCVDKFILKLYGKFVMTWRRSWNLCMNNS